MRPVLRVLLSAAILAACASNGAEPTSSSPAGASTTPTTGPEPGGVATNHPCDTMVVDPQDFVDESYPEMEELEREDTDADWLRADGAVGCLVRLTAPGETFTARSVEGYVFDASITPASELVDIRVANAISDVAGIEIAETPGAFGLVGEGADKPYAVVMEAGGVGAYVQSNSQEVSVEALVAIVRSILEG